MEGSKKAHAASPQPTRSHARDAVYIPTQMRVRKRNGSFEPVDVNKIVRAVGRCCFELHHVDAMRVATKTISGLYDGATTKELDRLSIQTAAALIVEEPEYSQLGARLLSTYIDKEVENQEIHSFSQSIASAYSQGLVNERVSQFVTANSRKLNNAIDPDRNYLFEFFGLRTVYDRYLLRHRTSRDVIETPQYFFMRVACGLSETAAEAIELYTTISQLDYVPSTPTLFNSGTQHEQLSSCFLLDSPEDSLEGIYRRYTDVAMLSKYSGGIGIAYHRVRSEGSLIMGTNGKSNGIVPWLKTLDASVAAVNQCFAPETVVFTADGPKEIKDVQVGDLVLGQRGQYRQVTDHFVYRQKDAMVELDIKHSLVPTHVTAGHPFWAIQGVPLEQSISRTLSQLNREVHKATWVEAGKLRKGDYVAQVIPQEIVPVQDFTEADARLYGILLGDGHISKNRSEFGVSGHPEKDAHMQFVREYLTARGIHFWEASRNETFMQIRWSGSRGVVREGTTGRFVGAGEPSLPVTYQDLYDQQGRKRIARRFSHLPHPQTKALLQGLLETDGGVSRGKEIYFTNKSQPLAEGVRYQLLRLGIASAGQSRDRDNSHQGVRSDGTVIQFKGQGRYYDVRIPAVQEIAELVDCQPIVKKNWLVWDNCLWTRVRQTQKAESPAYIHDLKVEGDETYMTSGALVHNGGRRKGACCVYLESWHADIEDFLELRDNTGDDARRTHNLNLANWVPDMFMKRVQADDVWSLFDPKEMPHLTDLYGAEFEAAYLKAETEKRFKKQVKARDLYGRMMRTLAQTGNGWMTFKDSSNRKCNQAGRPENVVHLSNLCTEIIEVTSPEETAVCNLGSVNLGQHVVDGAFDFDKLAKTVRLAIRQLDRVIDLNFYPISTTKTSNMRWRNVGLGIMGLQDVFFKLRMPFDSEASRQLSARIQEEIYFAALDASCKLAEKKGAHPAFPETRAAQGQLQFDLWGVTPTKSGWEDLRHRIKTHGLRNSLLLAIAPTATIASIAGCYECIEPQVSNLFKRETLSGDFLQINKYLVQELKNLSLWNEDIRVKIKLGEGSIQEIAEIPDDVKMLYRTAWEIPMRSLIDMAAERGAFIDQSQSLNLFVESPNIGKLSSMYMYAWQKGLKTTYYLRSRPATRIAKATIAATETVPVAKPVVTDQQALACSLENPESCESCQ
ncbi:MAG: ribonucleoside-diphosphate reductase subunit alpha [Blastocatellia bacterium]|nr:ribonucleoside-diphosphate reductase subunit alpha [Blastocatellia bacterium]